MSIGRSRRGVVARVRRTTAAGTLYFDSQVQTRLDTSAYPTGHNQDRVTVVNDPAGVMVGGVPRKVLKFDVREVDNQLTGNPRAQLETQKAFFEGDDIYIGYSVFCPTGAQGSGEFFPSSLPPGGDTWLNLGEVYGPPYTGRSAVMLGMKSGHAGLSFQRNATYSWDTVWTSEPVQKGIWYDWVLHEKLSIDPAVGFVELWQNTGTGWVKQSLNGSTNPLFMKTLDTAHDDSANYHKIALYYQSNMGFGSIQVYHGPHKVGSTFDIVAPSSYA